MQPNGQASSAKIFLCERHIARGDVLLTTPVLQALKQRYPTCRIFYRTDHPEVLRGNSNVAGINVVSGERGPSECCDFNLGDRPNPRAHIIDRFARAAGFYPGEVVRQLDFFPDPIDFGFATHYIPDRAVVVAAGPGYWIGRNWPESRWQQLCRYLLDNNYYPVLVGTEKDYQLDCTLDLRGKTSYHQMAACISRAVLFIGIDSFPLHVAGAMRVPRVALFGVTLPNLILCDAPKTISVQSDCSHPLTGMRHRVGTMHQIERDARRSNPMDTIPVAAVVDAVGRQLNLGSRASVRV